jgi:hypothetical protein
MTNTAPEIGHRGLFLHGYVMYRMSVPACWAVNRRWAGVGFGIS